MSEEKSTIDLAAAAQSGSTTAPGSPVIGEAPKPAQRREGEEREAPNQILDELLKNVKSKISWAELRLPSSGFNDSKVETIEIRPFTFEDEKVLRTVKTIADGAKIIEKLITRCMKGIDYNDLLVSDKNYILYKLREISYGDKYDIELTCGNCATKNELQVELSKLPVHYAETPEDLNKTITLPDSEVEVVIQALKVTQEMLFQSTDQMFDNLWRLIYSINGHTERTVKQGFVRGTTARDISVIRQAITDDSIGLQTKVNFVCNECEYHESLELPLNESFFDAS